LSSIDCDILRDCQEINVVAFVVGNTQISSLDNRALKRHIILGGSDAPTKEIGIVDCVVLEGYFSVAG